MTLASRLRRMKALALVFMLAVAEARRVRQAVDAHLQQREREAAVAEQSSHAQQRAGHGKVVEPRKVKRVNEEVEAMKANPDLRAQAKLQEEDAKLDELANLASGYLGEMMDNPKLQEQAKRVGEQMEALMADAWMQNQSWSVCKQFQAIRDDPKLREQAKLVAEELEAMRTGQNAEEQEMRIGAQIEAMVADPTFQERAKRIGEQMKAILAAPKWKAQAQLFGQHFEAMQTDPKLRKQASLLAERMEAIMGDAELWKLEEDVAEQTMPTLDDAILHQRKQDAMPELRKAGSDSTTLASPSSGPSAPTSFLELAGPLEMYKEIPPFSRVFMTCVLLLSLGMTYKLINPYHLILDFGLVGRNFQLWRLLTPFLFAGTFSSSFLFRLVMMYLVLVKTESLFTLRYADFMTLTLFVMASTMLFSWMYGEHLVLHDPFIFAMLYVWCKMEPNVTVRLYFIPVLSAHLPWIFLAISILSGGDPIKNLIGIGAGQSYLLLHDHNWLKTPRIFQRLINWFERRTNQGRPPSNVHGYFEPGGRLGRMDRQPNNQSLGGNQFRAFSGGGHRLGTS